VGNVKQRSIVMRATSEDNPWVRKASRWLVAALIRNDASHGFAIFAGIRASFICVGALGNQGEGMTNGRSGCTAARNEPK